MVVGGLGGNRSIQAICLIMKLHGLRAGKIVHNTYRAGILTALFTAISRPGLRLLVWLKIKAAGF